MTNYSKWWRERNGVTTPRERGEFVPAQPDEMKAKA
jgi:hypothetical protein